MSKDDLIILTGGAGFIGSCFLWKLNQQGEKNVIVVDHDDSVVKMKNLDGKEYKDYLEKENFIKEVKRDKFPKNIKAIFHLGACSSTTETDARYLERNNTEYSRILCGYSLIHNIPFYYASSAATYGDGSQGYSDQDEDTPKLKPMNLYGKSKQDFDLWVLDHKFADKIVGFKYFNVFGPNEYHKGNMRSLIVKAYEQIKRDGKVRLFKSNSPEYQDGEQKRDFIYVKDCVELMYRFYKDGKVKGIYNIGTGKARTWNDLVKAIFAALKMEPQIEYIEMPESIKDKYQNFTQAELAKLKKSGIKHKFSSLEDSVADYVKNYLENDFAVL